MIAVQLARRLQVEEADARDALYRLRDLGLTPGSLELVWATIAQAVRIWREDPRERLAGVLQTLEEGGPHLREHGSLQVLLLPLSRSPFPNTPETVRELQLTVYRS